MKKEDYKIVKINDIKFGTGKATFYGYALHNEKDNTYASFDKNVPYIPCGGIAALQSILLNEDVEKIFPYWIKAGV
jgi:uncharacterized alpha/beta hydrolase family protein